MTDTETPDQKQLSNTLATLALAGVAVNELENGAFLVSSCKWCAARYCPDFAALVAISRQMTEVQ